MAELVSQLNEILAVEWACVRALRRAESLCDDPGKLWIFALGGLRNLDRDHRRALSVVPLVRRPQETAQGLVAGVPVTSVRG